MPDEMREKFDQMFSAIVSRQSRITRRMVESKREEIWNMFNSGFRCYYDDAMKWRRHFLESKDSLGS